MSRSSATSPPLRRPERAGRAAALVALAALGVALGAAALPRVVVEGGSMAPLLRPGDRLVVVPLPPRVGRLVVLRDPRVPERVLVKRVLAVGADGVEVRGDAPAASTDSRHFGAVPRDLVIGRPAYRYEPADAARWLLRA